MILPEFDIIHEGHVVRRMPVQAVAMEVKRDGVYQPVNWLHDLKYILLSSRYQNMFVCTIFLNCKLLIYLLSVLLGRTVGDGEGARYEVILHVNDDDGRSRPHNLLPIFYFLHTINKNHLFNPAIPAKHKLLLAHAAISGHIEDHE